MCDKREEKRQHIDIIESTITRMSENSKQMKEWCVVLVSGLISVYFTTQIFWLVVVAVFATVLFGYLDAFYLMLERRYRYLYNDVNHIENRYKLSKKCKISDCLKRKKCKKKIFLGHRYVPLYGMSIKKYEKYVTFFSAISSKSILPFYGGFILALIVLFGVSYNTLNEEKVTKVELSNKQIGLEIDNPLNINVKKMDSLKISLDAMDSLLVKFDELKKLNVQISNTVKTNSVVRSK